MNYITPISEYHFIDGKFVPKSKFKKIFRRGLAAMCFAAGLLTANMTAGTIQYYPNQLFVEKTPQDKVADFIQVNNKEVDRKEAKQIAESTFKWAEKFEIDPLVLLAIQKVESSFNKHSISSTGAFGLMQIIPSWHRDKIVRAKENLGNPELFHIDTNIYLGAWVLKDCIKQFSLTKNALNCYNGSNSKPNGYDKKVASSYVEIEKFMKE